MYESLEYTFESTVFICIYAHFVVSKIEKGLLEKWDDAVGDATDIYKTIPCMFDHPESSHHKLSCNNAKLLQKQNLEKYIHSVSY